MNTNPYRLVVTANTHNGTNHDASSGIDIAFTVRTSVELTRRARAFFHAHKTVTATQIGHYPDSGRAWLKRFAGYVKSVDDTLDLVGQSYQKCHAASAICLLLLENRMKVFEVGDEIGQHPWVRGTVDLVQSMKLGRLTPEERDAITAPLIERFNAVLDATLAAKKRHAERTGPESNHLHARNVMLMNVRVRANQQLAHHYGWSQESADEHAVSAGLVLKTFSKRQGAERTTPTIGEV